MLRGKVLFFGLFANLILLSSNVFADDFFCDSENCGSSKAAIVETSNSKSNSDTASLLSTIENKKANKTQINQVLPKKQLSEKSFLASMTESDKNPFALDDTTGLYFFSGYVHNIANVGKVSNGVQTHNFDSTNSVKRNNPGYYVAFGARFYDSNFLVAAEMYYMEQGNKTTYLTEMLANQYRQVYPNGNTTTVSNTIAAATNINIQRVYGLTGHIGGGFARFNIYGIIGLAVADISHHTVATYTNININESIDKTSVGFTYGIGADFYITNNIFISARYQEYRFDYKINPRQYQYASGEPIQLSYSTTMKQIIVGAGLRFF